MEQCGLLTEYRKRKSIKTKIFLLDGIRVERNKIAHEQKLFATFLKRGYNRIIMKNKTNQKEITMRRNLTNSDTAGHKCYQFSIELPIAPG